MRFCVQFMLKLKTGHTVAACFVGYITQAIINNFAPLLFVTFNHTYGISLSLIGAMITVNFGIQLLVDLLASKFADKIGYRPLIVTAHVMAAAGLILLSVLPDVLPSPAAGLFIAAAVYAVGGGLIEVLVSPIVEACPYPNKKSMMSLLHSFYCWGQVGVVALSTLFFVTAGIGNWRILACVWSAVPVLNALLFAFVPMYELNEESGGMTVGGLLRSKMFWLFVVLMICAGSSEIAVSQWASAFAESALGVSKTFGDLVGPCTFALFMGLARAFFAKMGDRLPLNGYMTFCCILCIGSYLLAATGIPAVGMLGCGLCGFSVGVLWPGCFSTAARILPGGGTAMYAMLALAGDIGCSAGPTLVGTVAGAFGEDLRPAMIFAVIFPALLIAALAVSRKLLSAEKTTE